MDTAVAPLLLHKTAAEHTLQVEHIYLLPNGTVLGVYSQLGSLHIQRLVNVFTGFSYALAYLKLKSNDFFSETKPSCEAQSQQKP